MLDLIKRFCIVLALATFIGALFLGTITTLAAEKEHSQHPTEESDHLIWPVDGEVTDTYGTRGGKHYGIDIAAPEGTPVLATEKGTATRSYYSDTYGHVIFIKHADGMETVYAHLSERHVIEGQAVGKGEKIGTVGNTGHSTGNHLHFEVHKGSWNVEKTDAIDPLLVLAEKNESIHTAIAEPTVANEQNEPEREAESVSNESEEIKVPTIEGENDRNTAQNTIHHSVVAGDTLWGLATQFEVTVTELKKWNQLDDDLIYVGDVIMIHQENSHYVIYKGDTLSAIAEKYKMTVDEVKELNDLSTDLIYPGDQLIVSSFP